MNKHGGGEEEARAPRVGAACGAIAFMSAVDWVLVQEPQLVLRSQRSRILIAGLWRHGSL